jgi:hypothetical protein
MDEAKERGSNCRKKVIWNKNVDGGTLRAPSLTNL